MKKEGEYDLQDRLVDYAVRIITLSEALPETKAGKHACISDGSASTGNRRTHCLSVCERRNGQEEQGAIATPAVDIGYSKGEETLLTWGRTANPSQLSDKQKTRPSGVQDS